MVYVNGVDDSSSPVTPTGTLFNSDTFFRLGAANNTDPNGTIDEVRVSNIGRSAGWIKTEYNDQSSPSTFLTVGAAVAGAVSGTQTFTVSINPGVLTVTAPAPVTGPNLSPGTTAAAANLGALNYTDTLNDATAWGVTLAATDLGAGTIPFTRFSIGVTPTGNISAVPGATGVPTAGAASQTLAGADGVPGTTYSTPITLASATAAVEGSYSTPAGATGNTITIVVPGTAPAGGPFTSTLQYTITG